MNQAHPARATYPEATEQQLNGTTGLSRQPVVDPVFRQASITPAPIPPPGFLPRAAHPFVSAHAEGYPHRGRVSFDHVNPPLQSFAESSHPARLSGSFVNGIHGVQSVENSQDPRRHSLPIRRPAHWEDDPYPARSLRDSMFRCYSSLDHRSCYGQRHDFLDGCISGCGLGHCQHMPQVFQGMTHLQHPCGHWGYPDLSQRYSTLMYAGPPTHYTCQSCRPPIAHQAASSSFQQNDVICPEIQHPGKTYSNRKARREGKERWGGSIKKWFNKRFPFMSDSHNSEHPNTTEKAVPRHDVSSPLLVEKRPKAHTSAMRRVSPSSLETVGNISRPRGLSYTSDTVAGSSSLHIPISSQPPDDQSGPEAFLPENYARLIPRPPSTVSTCQCLPSGITLHRMLRHNPFDQPPVKWDITVSPSTIFSPDLKLNFLDDLATNPPARHLFINGIGDFPLEICQGDPDPSRSKNRERHLHQSEDGTTMVEKRTLPWPIRITGTGMNGYIILNDVLRAIYLNFQEYIPSDEYDLYTIQRKRLITAAYHLRQKVLEEKRNWPPGPVPLGYARPIFHEDRIEDGIMRCDYVGSQLMFRGLDVSPDQEGYTLFLGPVT